MQINDVDWNKLKPYGDGQRKSFEELCYQLVARGQGLEAELTSIEGAGGDGGVEFYRMLPNGEVHGWQCKFFQTPTQRLKHSGRKDQIKDSLARACRKHPRLVRWTLMTPGNLTNDELEWLRNQLAASQHNKERVVPEGRSIELVSCGESQNLSELGKPQCEGIRKFFFGEIELTPSWFDEKYRRIESILSRKFEATLHSTTTIDRRVALCLGEPELLHELEEAHTALTSGLARLAKARTDLSRLEAKEDQDKRALANYIHALGLFHDQSAAALRECAVARDALRAASWRIARDRPPASTETALASLMETSHVLRDDGFELSAGSSLHESWIRHYLREPTFAARECHEAVTEARDLLGMLAVSEAHLLGAAGLGKTHSTAQATHRRIQENRPAILLLGLHFTTSEPISEQVLKQLGLASTSWKDFVSALDVCARVHGTRIPIIIDGLNEATQAGALNPVWGSHLETFCAETRSYSDSILILTSCRTSYRNAIWPEAASDSHWYLRPDTSYDVRDALTKYFSEYKINADPSAAVLAQFQHPIYLRLFCEATNPARENEIEVALGEQALFSVFDRYVDAVNARIVLNLRRPAGTKLTHDALSRIAEHLWVHPSRGCALDSVYELVDNQSRASVDVEDSLVNALEREDLILLRDWGSTGEQILFAYDLMAGYWIAKHIIAKAASDPAGFFASEALQELLWGDFSDQHPLAEDIVRCVAALVRTELGQSLHDLVERPEATHASVRSLFELSPEFVGTEGRNFVAELFQEEQNRQFLLELAETTWSHPTHPLNADFWSPLLAGLPMPDRDISWSEHVRYELDSHERRVRDLESSARELVGGQAGPPAERLRLMAQHAMWMLTSTVRRVRDEATRALFWFGRAHPDNLLNMLEQSLVIDDAYVRERCLAALYGACMTGAANGNIDVPRKLYDWFFAQGAKYATTHALIRDYARHAIERTLLKAPEVLSAEEAARIRPPFSEDGIREWGEKEEREEGQYGAAPIHMDFGNYTLGRLVKGRQNYDLKHPEYVRVRRQLFWRMYELGYSIEIFGEMDSDISRLHMHGRSEEPDKIDRYGKKYSWIAFFELYGHREDLGLLKDSALERGRPTDVDIEPSFPAPHGDIPELEVVAKVESICDLVRTDGVSSECLAPLSGLIETRLPAQRDAEWILLDGFVNQTTETWEVVCWLNAFIVDADDAERLVSAAADRKVEAKEFVQPQDHYTFAGETIWSDRYPDNENEFLTIEHSRQRVKKVDTELALLREGKRLAPEEERAKLAEISKRVLPLVEAEDENADDVLGKILASEGIALDEVPLEYEVEEAEEEEIEVLCPIRNSGWEDYHTVTCQNRRHTSLARQIAAELDLVSHPDQWELFDAAGNQGTVNVAGGDPWTVGHNFFYIRRDLLECYLARHSKVLVVISDLERFDLPYKPNTRDEMSRAWVIRPSNGSSS